MAGDGIGRWKHAISTTCATACAAALAAAPSNALAAALAAALATPFAARVGCTPRWLLMAELLARWAGLRPVGMWQEWSQTTVPLWGQQRKQRT